MDFFEKNRSKRKTAEKSIACLIYKKNYSILIG